MKSVYSYLFSFILLIFLVSCGSSSSSSENIGKNKGIVVDDIVVGVKYLHESGDSGYTNENGEFPYKQGLTQFFIGDIKVGEISTLPSDGYVFIQDMLDLSRSDVSNENLIKVATLLQSLDEDKQTDTIEIKNSDLKKFITGTQTDIKKMSSNNLETMLRAKLSYIKNKEEVKAHLKNSQKKFNKTQVNDTVKPNLAGSNITNGSTNVHVNTDFILIFNENIPRNKKLKSYFSLKKQNNENIDFNINQEFNQANKLYTIKISLKQSLSYNTKYILTVSKDLKDYAGNSMDTEQKIEFTSQNSSLADTIKPVFTNNSLVQVDENQKSVMTLNARDENSVTYFISGADASSFNLNASTGLITFKSAPDYEIKSSYFFTAKARDSFGNFNTLDITVRINDLDESKPNTVQNSFRHIPISLSSGLPASFSLSGRKFVHPQPNMGSAKAFYPEVITVAKPDSGYVVAWRDYSSLDGEGGIVFTQFDNNHNELSSYRFNPQFNIGESYISRDFRITSTVYGQAYSPIQKRTDSVVDDKGRNINIKGTVFGGRFQASTLTSKNLHFSGCSLFYHKDDVQNAKNSLLFLKAQIQSESKAQIIAKHENEYNKFKSQLSSQKAKDAYTSYTTSLQNMSEEQLKTLYANEIDSLINIIDIQKISVSSSNRFHRVRAVQIGRYVTYDTLDYLRCEPYYSLYQVKESSVLKGKLTKLLGFTIMDNGNYAFAYSYGYRGMGTAFFDDAPRERTAIRIIKPNGTLVKEKVILGLNKPSEHSSRYNSMILASSRLASGQNRLALHLPTQYNYPGQGEHQGSWFALFDENLNQVNGDHKTTRGFHNMDQRLFYDSLNNRFVTLWTSDGGGGISIAGYSMDNVDQGGKESPNTPTTSLFKPEEKPASSTTNFTYAQLGQTVALENDEYATIFTAALKTKTISSNYNLFFYKGKIDGDDVNSNKLIQYTNFVDAGKGNTAATMKGTNIINPKMFTLGGNLLVIYQKVLKNQNSVEGTYSMLIDKNGRILQSPALLKDENNNPVHIPRGAEAVVLKNGDIVWSIGRTDSNAKLNIYTILGTYK